MKINQGLGQDLFLGQLRDLQQQNTLSSNKATQKPTTSFTDHLMEGVKEVDQMQKQADKAATDLAAGKHDNIHETMLAASQAELSFNLMVQMRNKILEAYQEVMRMPV